jgi:Domain of unknown function (DUF1905)
MLDLNITFSDICKVWVSKTRWYFVQVPVENTEEIRFFSSNLQMKKRGFGAVKVTVNIGDVNWQTSIFPSFKTKQYLLFLKAEVRKRAKIAEGDKVKVSLNIRL